MPWIAAAAAVAPSVIGALGGGGGGSARGVNLTSAQSDPWNLQARQESLDYQKQQGAFVNALQQNVNPANQAQVFGQQQQLAGQLQQNALGQGPNPAQAMLANQTGQNVSQQAALMGSQRGASQNVGQMQRQAAQQGAGIQQNAIGQGAALQAQQQLAAQQQLGQQQAMMAGNASNMMQLGLQGGQGQVGNLQNQQSMQLANLQNWNAANNTAAGNQGAQGVEYAGLQQKQQGAIAGGIGSAIGAFGTGKANGGMIGYANGGAVCQSAFGNKIKGMNMRSGGGVPGRAQVSGDSRKNDTVPAVLSPGEIVIPRSQLSGPNAGDNAKRFVEAVLAKQSRR